jgi:hypothetical protein
MKEKYIMHLYKYGYVKTDMDIDTDKIVYYANKMRREKETGPANLKSENAGPKPVRRLSIAELNEFMDEMDEYTTAEFKELLIKEDVHALDMEWLVDQKDNPDKHKKFPKWIRDFFGKPKYRKTRKNNLWGYFKKKKNKSLKMETEYEENEDDDIPQEKLERRERREKGERREVRKTRKIVAPPAPVPPMQGAPAPVPPMQGAPAPVPPMQGAPVLVPPVKEKSVSINVDVPDIAADFKELFADPPVLADEEENKQLKTIITDAKKKLKTKSVRYNKLLSYYRSTTSNREKSKLLSSLQQERTAIVNNPDLRKSVTAIAFARSFFDGSKGNEGETPRERPPLTARGKFVTLLSQRKRTLRSRKN